jgi:hypothetical protein
MYGITKFAMANPGLLKIAMASKELAPKKTGELEEAITSVDGRRPRRQQRNLNTLICFGRGMG